VKSALRGSEFETNLRRERQLEGIASAKARGVYKGRKASIDAAKIKKMKAGHGAIRHCQSLEDWSGIGLSGVE